MCHSASATLILNLTAISLHLLLTHRITAERRKTLCFHCYRGFQCEFKVTRKASCPREKTSGLFFPFEKNKALNIRVGITSSFITAIPQKGTNYSCLRCKWCMFNQHKTSFKHVNSFCLLSVGNTKGSGGHSLQGYI